MIKTDRAFALKNSKGGVVQIVREHYLRDDIPCRSQLCNTCPGGMLIIYFLWLPRDRVPPRLS
jgi:hypothetical protein